MPVAASFVSPESDYLITTNGTKAHRAYTAGRNPNTQTAYIYGSRAMRSTSEGFLNQENFRWIVGAFVAAVIGLSVYVFSNLSSDVSELKTDMKQNTKAINEAKHDFIVEIRKIEAAISSVEKQVAVSNQHLSDIAGSIKQGRR